VGKLYLVRSCSTLFFPPVGLGILIGISVLSATYFFAGWLDPGYLFGTIYCLINLKPLLLMSPHILKKIMHQRQIWNKTEHPMSNKGNGPIRGKLREDLYVMKRIFTLWKLG